MIKPLLSRLYQLRVRQEHERRNVQVLRRGLVLEHATRQVERGAMARADETGVTGKLHVGACGKRTGRRATQVRADADHDQQVFMFGAGAGFVLAVVRRLHGEGHVGLGVGDFSVGFLERFQHFGRALEQPDRLAAPFHHLHLARSQVTHVRLYGRARCTGFFRWCECANERGRNCNPSHTTSDGRRNQQIAAPFIDVLLVTHSRPQGEKSR